MTAICTRKGFLGLAGAFAAQGLRAGERPPVGRPDCIRYSCDVPVYGDYDVAVFGAGPGGIGAAVAAARAGKKTILVERYNFPGGVGAWASTPLFFQFEGPDAHGNQFQMIRGICDETVRMLDRCGHARFYANDDHKELEPGPIGDQPLRGKVYFDAEYLKIAYHDLLDAAGVEKLFMTALSGAVTDGRRLTEAVVTCLEGPRAIRAKTFVDATGDAFLVQLAGGETFQASPYETMHKSMFMEVCGVKPHSYVRNAERYAELYAQHKLPENVWCGHNYCHFAQADHYSIPEAYAVGDCCSSRDMTRMDAELRRLNAELLDVYRREFEGYGEAYWITGAQQVCSRDGRHVRGRDTVDLALIRGEREVVDGVVPILRKWGAHSPRQREGFAPAQHGHLPGLKSIPYGALVSKSFDNVLVAGRGLSVEPEVAGTCRMMPTCMAQGQVAGTAAALALDFERGDVGRVRYAELRRRLEDSNHICC